VITSQKFKGDETELKYEVSAKPVLDLISGSLDELLEGAELTDAFLLMLYDEGRIPYSNRIKREVFVQFIKGAFLKFPFMGSFESYIFILREIFGPDTDLIFEVPAPGKLNLSVNASSDLVYDFIARELDSGFYTFYNISTSDGDDLVFKGLAGIETESELALLFSEIMPAGIFPTISLDYFLKSTFYGEDTDGVFDMITSIGDSLIFIEVSGG